MDKSAQTEFQVAMGELGQENRDHRPDTPPISSLAALVGISEFEILFKSAIMHGDVVLLERYSRFDAALFRRLANLDIAWRECSCRPEEDCHHVLYTGTMMGLALAMVDAGFVPPEVCIIMLKMLLDKNFLMMEAEAKCLPSGKSQTVMELAFMQLLRRHDDKKVQGLVQIIQLLDENGAFMPKVHREIVQAPEDVDDAGPFLDHFDLQPVAVAMMFHCPPSLLRTVLEAYRRQGFSMNNREELQQWRFGIVTHLDHLVRQIHTFLFHPSGAWTESSEGEIIRSLDEKIKLLVEFNAILDCDKVVMDNLAVALKKVYYAKIMKGHHDMHRSSSSLDHHDKHRFSQLCWETLVEPILVLQDSPEYANQQKKEVEQHFTPLHSFAISPARHLYDGICLECRGTISPAKWNPKREGEDSIHFYVDWEIAGKPSRAKMNDMFMQLYGRSYKQYCCAGYLEKANVGNGKKRLEGFAGNFRGVTRTCEEQNLDTCEVFKKSSSFRTRSRLRP